MNDTVAAAAAAAARGRRKSVRLVLAHWQNNRIPVCYEHGAADKKDVFTRLFEMRVKINCAFHGVKSAIISRDCSGKSCQCGMGDNKEVNSSSRVGGVSGGAEEKEELRFQAKCVNFHPACRAAAVSRNMEKCEKREEYYDGDIQIARSRQYVGYLERARYWVYNFCRYDLLYGRSEP
jgi:hypothetical protein